MTNISKYTCDSCEKVYGQDVTLNRYNYNRKLCDECIKLCDNCENKLDPWQLDEFICGKLYCSECKKSIPNEMFELVIKEWDKNFIKDNSNLFTKYKHADPDNPCKGCQEKYSEYIECYYCKDFINKSDIQLYCECGRNYCCICVGINARGGWCPLCECGKN